MKKILSHLTLFSAFFLIFVYSSASFANTPGAWKGSFKVENGAAAYSLPINIPNGVLKLSPSLSLSYNSSGNGGSVASAIVGNGWSLTGLSTISRCKATIAQDGFRSGIDFNASRYCLDGARLFAVGTYDGGIEYKKEFDDFSRIVSYGSNSDNPSKFKVWTRDGKILSYGETSDSQLEAPNQTGKVLLWALDKVEDESGNFYNIFYTKQQPSTLPGLLLPQFIHYTGHTSGLAPTRLIYFQYRSYKKKGYFSGSYMYNRYLSSISTYVDASVSDPTSHNNPGITGTLVKRFHIDGVVDSKTFLVEGVRECDAAGSCYAPTSFTVDRAESPVLGLQKDTGLYLPNIGGKPDRWNKFADVNGDGWLDLFKVTPIRNIDGSWGHDVNIQFGEFGLGGNATPDLTYLQLPRSESYTDAQGIVDEDQLLRAGFDKWNDLIDVNRDGYVDIVSVMLPNTVPDEGVQTAGIYIYYGDAEGNYSRGDFELDAVALGKEGLRFWNQWGDFNGDGVLDLLRIDSAYDPETGTSPDTHKIQNSDDYYTNIILTDDTDNIGFYYPYFEILFGEIDPSGDFNFSGSKYDSFDNGVSLAEYNAQREVTVKRYSRDDNVVYKSEIGFGFRESNHIGDMDGDGQIDIAKVHILPNTVNPFLPKTISAGVKILLGRTVNNNYSFFSAPTQNQELLTLVDKRKKHAQALNFANRILDVNGDGVLDIVRVLPELHYECEFEYEEHGYPKSGYLSHSNFSSSIAIALGRGDGTFEPSYVVADAINPDGMNTVGEVSSVFDIYYINSAALDGIVPDKYINANTDNTCGDGLPQVSSVVFQEYYPTNISGIGQSNLFLDIDQNGLLDILRMEKNQIVGTSATISGLHDFYGAQYNPRVTVISSVLTNGNEEDAVTDRIRYMDINSDGMLDEIQFEGPNFVTAEDASLVKWKPNALKKTRMVREVSEPDGKVIILDYQPITLPHVHTPRASGSGITSLVFPMYVVAGYTLTDSARSYAYDFSFHYEGSGADYKRGWLGFSKIIENNLQTNTFTETQFHQDYPYTGRPSYIRKGVNGLNKQAYQAETQFTWGERVTGPSRFIFRSSMQQHRFDKRGRFEHRQITNYLNSEVTFNANIDALPYDQYGHPEVVETTFGWGAQLPIVQRVEHQTTYSDASTIGNFARLSQRVITHRRPNAVGGEPSPRVIDESYNSLGLLDTVLTGEGSAQRKTKKYIYNEYGNIRTTYERANNIAYNDAGTMLTLNPPFLQDETQFNYSDLGSVNPKVSRSKMTYTGDLGSAFVSKTTYDSRWNAPIRLDLYHTDGSPLRRVTTWEYDSFGRMTTENRPDLTKTETWYTSGCISNCPAFSSVAYTVSSQEYASDNTALPEAIAFYDGLGRLVRTKHTGRNNELVYSDIEYDSAGRIHKQSRPYFSTDSAQYIESIYDPIGRLSKMIQPDGGYTEYAYEGSSGALGIKQVSSQVGDGKRLDTVRYLDPVGQVSYVIEPNGAKTSYSYYPFGELSHINQGVTSFSFEYDDIGRLTGLRDPDLGFWQYKYNGLDQLRWQKDARNQVTHFRHDERGRLVRREEPSGVSEWDYDDAPNGFGQIYKETGPNGYSRTYSYLRNGKLSSEVTRIDGQDYTVGYQYDVFGRLEFLNYPNNALSLQYKYINDHLSEVVNHLKVNEYNAAGRPKQFEYGALHSVTRIFDTMGRIKNQSHSHPEVGNHTYIYGQLGNLTSRNLEGVVNESYLYDSLNRLTHINGAEYARYDGLGNITYRSDVGDYFYRSDKPHAVTDINPVSGGVTNPAAGDANGDGVINDLDVLTTANEILGLSAGSGESNCNGDSGIDAMDIACILANGGSVSSGSYQYDDNGNISVSPGRIYAYTSFNKPDLIAFGSQQTSFAYDGNHKRIKKVVSDGTNTTTTIYVDDYYEKIVTPQGTRHRYTLLDGDGVPFAVQTTSNISGEPAQQTHYLWTDYLGSVIATTNETGVRKSLTGYKPFGESESLSGTIEASTSLGYSGHESDRENGFINMNARIYDPFLGRFLSPDPVMPNIYNPQALNRYSYVYNNPFRFIDPSGNIPILPGDPNYTETTTSDGYYDPGYNYNEQIFYEDWQYENALFEQNYDFGMESLQADLFTNGGAAILLEPGFIAGENTLAWGGGDSCFSCGVHATENIFLASRGSVSVGTPIYDENGQEIGVNLDPSGDSVGQVMSGSTEAASFVIGGATVSVGAKGFLAWLKGVLGFGSVAKRIPGFSKAESSIIHEARGILGSSELAQIRAAHAAGKPLSVNIGGRLVQYEPGLSASGMTMFGENGFLIGREAFSSQTELRKTVLHELHRLNTSASSTGVSGSLAAQETKAAFEFAERAIKQLGGQ